MDSQGKLYLQKVIFAMYKMFKPDSYIYFLKWQITAVNNKKVFHNQRMHKKCS